MKKVSCKAIAIVIVCLLFLSPQPVYGAELPYLDSGLDSGTGAFAEIINIYDKKLHQTCFVGDSPADLQYPDATSAILGVNDVLELPLEWDFQPVDFNMPGEYEVVGHFSQKVLSTNKIANPRGITVPMTITVIEKGPIRTLSATLLSVGKQGNAIATLQFPAWEGNSWEGPQAVWIYRSTDQIHWEKDIKGSSFQEEDGYFPKVNTVGKETYFVYRYTSNGHPVWLKAYLEGSLVEGMTNVVCLEAAESDGLTGGTQDNGSSGGNRGGIQGETERTGQVSETEDAAPEQENTEAPPQDTDPEPTVPSGKRNQQSKPIGEALAVITPDAFHEEAGTQIMPAADDLQKEAPDHAAQMPQKSEGLAQPLDVKTDSRDLGAGMAVAAATVAVFAVATLTIYLRRRKRKL